MKKAATNNFEPRIRQTAKGVDEDKMNTGSLIKKDLKQSSLLIKIVTEDIKCKYYVDEWINAKMLSSDRPNLIDPIFGETIRIFLNISRILILWNFNIYSVD